MIGSRVEAHPHRPRVLSYRDGGSDLTISVRRMSKGSRVVYGSLLLLKDATFAVQPSGPTRVREVTGVRDVHAFVRGEVVSFLDVEGGSAGAETDRLAEYGTLISYNPFKASHFYEVLPQPDGSHEAGRQIVSASVVLMRGGDCLAINPRFV